MFCHFFAGKKGAIQFEISIFPSLRISYPSWVKWSFFRTKSFTIGVFAKIPCIYGMNDASEKQRVLSFSISISNSYISHTYLGLLAAPEKNWRILSKKKERWKSKCWKKRGKVLQPALLKPDIFRLAKRETEHCALSGGPKVFLFFWDNKENKIGKPLENFKNLHSQIQHTHSCRLSGTKNVHGSQFQRILNGQKKM